MLEFIKPSMLAGKNALIVAERTEESEMLVQCFRAAGCVVNMTAYYGEEISFVPDVAIAEFSSDASANETESGPANASNITSADVLIFFPCIKETIADASSKSYMKEGIADAVGRLIQKIYIHCDHYSKTMIQKGWGRIIFIGSSQAKTGGWNTGADEGACVLSSTMCGLARSLAVELAPHGVTVNTILYLPQTEYIKGSMDKIPLDRLPDGEDIAGAALFLASEPAAFITGYSLDINCGLHMD